MSKRRLALIPVPGIMLILGCILCGCGGGGSKISSVAPDVRITAVKGYVYALSGSSKAAGDLVGGTSTYTPLESAMVRLTCGSIKRTATTDSVGFYSISNIPSGSCTIEIDKEGYDGFEKQVTINDEITYISYTTDGKLMGNVQLEGTTDNSGTTITVKQGDVETTLPIDSKGNFIIPKLDGFSDGKVTILASDTCESFKADSTEVNIMNGKITDTFVEGLTLSLDLKTPVMEDWYTWKKLCDTDAFGYEMYWSQNESGPYEELVGGTVSKCLYSDCYLRSFFYPAKIKGKKYFKVRASSLTGKKSEFSNITAHDYSNSDVDLTMKIDFLNQDVREGDRIDVTVAIKNNEKSSLSFCDPRTENDDIMFAIETPAGETWYITYPESMCPCTNPSSHEPGSNTHYTQDIYIYSNDGSFAWSNCPYCDYTVEERIKYGITFVPGTYKIRAISSVGGVTSQGTVWSRKLESNVKEFTVVE